MTGDCYYCGERGHRGDLCPGREFKDRKDIPQMTDKGMFGIYRDAHEYFNDAVFVELGCYLGGSSSYLAKLIKESEKNQILYCVDKWENFIDINVEGSIFFDFWRNIWDCGYEQIIRPIMFDSSRASQMFADRSVDFVYVDADHSYNKCYDDIISWMPKIKPGGIIAGHDFTGHVKKAVYDIFGRDKVENVLDTNWRVKLGDS